MILKNSLNQSHLIIKEVVASGSITIDATVGNGNDTIFLAGLVGEKGLVYGFDIQNEALDITRMKLKDKSIDKRVKLINDGHEYLDKYVENRVNAAMFNLGYLPKGDHKISTKFETTKIALEKAMKLLVKNGLITIVIYHGGDTGFEEKKMVLEFLQNIDYKRFSVMKKEYINQINYPPILVIIEKLINE